MPNIWFNIFEDELHYSAIARSKLYNSLTMTETQEIFFGNKYKRAQFYIPSGLSHFCKEFGYTTEDILYKHSIYKYYALFAPVYIQIRAFDNSLVVDSKAGTNPLTAFIGFHAENIYRLPQYYCTICAKEDKESVGTPYFHVSHNLPGIKVCYKHEISLQESPKSDDSEYQVLSEDGIMQSFVQKPNPHHIRIAQLSHELLTLDTMGLDRDIINYKLREQLRANGFFKNNGTVDQLSLAGAVKEYYGDFLAETGNAITGDNFSCWLRIITRETKKSYYLSPIKYLLLINMLVGSMSGLLSIESNVNKLSGKELQKKEVLYKKDILNIHKKRIMDAIGFHPEWTRNDFRENLSTSYRFVFQHDRAYIDSNLPQKYIKPKENIKKEYNYQRDIDYLCKLEAAHASLLSKRPCIRVTRCSLEKEAGWLNLIKNQNLKLSKEFINNVSESLYEYRIRMCKAIIDDNIKQGITPTLNEIMKASNLKIMKKFNPLIPEINIYIQKNQLRENLKI